MANRYPHRVGARVGRLTILADVGRRSRYRVWRCRCDCGREEDIPGYQLTRVTSCRVCRAPTCRWCGAPLPSASRRRTCDTMCRRALSAELTRQSRARLSTMDADYDAARARYNRTRLASDVEARAAKRAADRAYLRRMRDDPDWVEAERGRHRADYDARMSDAAYRERQRLRTAAYRRQKETTMMLADVTNIGKKQ